MLLALAFGGAMVPPALAAGKDQSASLSQHIRAEADGRIRQFYEARGYVPIWTADNKIGPAAKQLLDHVDEARTDGLDPEDYDTGKLRKLIAEAGESDIRKLAEAEVALSRSFARYVADMRAAKSADMIFLDKALKPKKRRADAVLRAASISSDFATYVNTMGWMSPHYVRQRRLMKRALDAGSDREMLRRLRVNLERARILPSAWTHHIVVDSASGRLWYYQAGAQKGTMRVVVGKPESPTPMYAGVVQYAVLKPYWNVPVDLTRKLIAPKVLAGKSLAALGYEALSDWGESPRKLAPGEIDWRAVARGDQELRVRQLPGPRNSMGRVKFMFPNETGIFLHDTPERKLFAKDRRHFSNGCIRLEDAAGLGRWLMGQPLPKGTAKPDQAMQLAAPVPIYMTYFTSIETKSGVGFLKDVYGRDGTKVANLLTK